jgi:hypothetical protein
MIEAFIREAPERVENVIDLGIFKGGSVSFLQEMFRPRRLVGLDLYKWPPAGPLESRISRQELSDAVRLDYETDQGRPPRVERIMEDNFPGDNLDLVIDDLLPPLCSDQTIVELPAPSGSSPGTLSDRGLRLSALAGRGMARA